MPHTDQDRFKKVFLLVLVAAISALFFVMIRRMLVALLLAAIFSGIVYPFYRIVLARFKGRRAAASVTTIVTVIVVAVLPLTLFIGIVTNQAINISKDVRPWIERWLDQPSAIEDTLIEKVPFVEELLPYRSQIIEKLGEFAGKIGAFLLENLSTAAKGTASFFLSLFVMLYAMFFFLMHGKEIVEKAVYYLPIAADDGHRMLEKFVSVTKATLKGTLVIGVIQGGLAGIAFGVVGIQGAAFWGTVMAVLSIVPGVGSALVWAPAVIYLFATGNVAAGVGLLIWCAGLVGTVDNLLRPRLVGRDTQMPDLLIFLGTLGGLFLFGAAGVIIGPIVAALFLTVWEIYGATFKDLLAAEERGGAVD